MATRCDGQHDLTHCAGYCAAAVEEVIRGRTTQPFEVVLERAIEALRPTTAVSADGTPERRAVQGERPAVQEERPAVQEERPAVQEG